MISTMNSGNIIAVQQYAILALLFTTDLIRYTKGTTLLNKSCEHKETPKIWELAVLNNISLKTLVPEPCIEKSEVILIESVYIYPPIDNCSNKCYNTIYNSSCLQQAGSEQVKNFMLPFMKEINGLQYSDIAQNLSISISQNLKAHNFYGLPDQTGIKLICKCEKKSITVTTLYMDICRENANTDERNHAFIDFNSTFFTSKTVCYCQVNSSGNITVKAIDVRLSSNVSLKLTMSNKQRYLEKDESDLFWLGDDVLLQGARTLMIELSGLDPSSLPDSMWLDIKGQNLYINCGMRNKRKEQIKNNPSTDKTWLYIIISAVAVVVCILVSGICLIFICKRKRKHTGEFEMRELDQCFTSRAGTILHKNGRSSSHEVIFSLPQAPPVPTEDTQHEYLEILHVYDGALQSLLPPQNEYIEILPEYEEPSPPNQIRKHDDTIATGAEKEPEASHGHVYKNMIEKQNATPSENLYEQVNTSNLKRNSTPPVTDYIYYSTCN